MELVRRLNVTFAALLFTQAASAAGLVPDGDQRTFQCYDSRRAEPVTMQVTADRLEIHRRDAHGRPERLEAAYRIEDNVLYLSDARLISETTGRVKQVPGERRTGSVSKSDEYIAIAEPLVPRGYTFEELERRVRAGELGSLVGLRWLMVCRAR